ncbi:hypothetical protein NZK35_29745 [Stieleria sp. ICT_E10.1]|uniref:hypothetical protein n=1 Tax=Stieleria sedimenti TaxID=2976331 RepID=UPI002180589B|nr:hypothetical protein [Stieleria sedimenti]MCS7470858.1 hypothetical protein [Stieleria sedimenti]
MPSLAGSQKRIVFERQSVKTTNRNEGTRRIRLPRFGTLSIELADRFTRQRGLIQNAANQLRLSVFPVETGGAGRSNDAETKADEARPDKRLA